MILKSPGQVRISPEELTPVEVNFPELLAPLARAIHNGKCPACGAMVHGVEDIVDGKARVQIACFGDPAHVFFFDASSGRVADQPDAHGTAGG